LKDGDSVNQYKKYSFYIFIIGILFFCNHAVLAGYIGNIFPEKDAAAFPKCWL
jgi:hypothetical protein